MGRPSVRGWSLALGRAACTATAYAVAAWLALQVGFSGVAFTPFWPATAVAAAGVWRWGWTGAVGVLVGSALLNTVITPLPTMLMIMIALGVMLSSLLVVAVLRWTAFDPALGRVRDALSLLLSTLATAVAGLNAVWWLDLWYPAGHWLQTARTWIIGDALGYIACVPALFSFSRLRALRLPLWETSLLTACTFGCAAVAFLTVQPGPGIMGPALFLVFPPVLWAALRLGGPGAASALLLVALAALAGAASGSGVFATVVDLHDRLGAFHAFLAALVITFLLVGSAMDEVRAANARSLAAARMEAVGRMAGGIAHDFNNLLAVVIGNTELVHRRIHDQELQRSLGRVIAAGGRCAELTRQLLAFSRGQPLELRTIDLAALVRSSEPVLADLAAVRPSARAEERVSVAIDIASPGPFPIHGDAIHLGQVLMNLVANARDAMPRGGVVTITLARQPDRALADGWIRLTVSDQGVGMDEATRARIFEPYFTTKRQGTGLGLSTVYGIVAQHGGRIAVESAPGAGSRFTIDLPATEMPAGAVGIVAEPPDALPTRILVVDDQPDISALIADLLQDGRRQIRTANSVATALALLAEWTPQLVITDWRLPDGEGGGILAALTGRPVAVVVITGFAESDTVLPEGVVVVAKPFTRVSLEAGMDRAWARLKSVV